MNALRLHGQDDLRHEDLPRPDLAPGEMLLRVRSALICGTDLRMVASGSCSGGLPRVLGHEMAGQVAEVADGAAGQWHRGQRIAVAPNVGCGRCDLCRACDTHLCADYRALGIHLDGAFAEFVRIPAAAIEQGNVVALADTMSFDTAALAESLSCVLSSADRLQPVEGATVLVLGAGVIGLMHAMLMQRLGARRVILSDPNTGRLERCGAVLPDVVTVEPDTLAATVDELTAGRGIDVAITACPAPEAQITALELAALNGRICLFGGLPKDRASVPLDTNRIHYRQLTLTGTTRSSPEHLRRAVGIIAEGGVPWDELVTSRFRLDEADRAFDAARSGAGWKSAIVFDG